MSTNLEIAKKIKAGILILTSTNTWSANTLVNSQNMNGLNELGIEVAARWHPLSMQRQTIIEQINDLFFRNFDAETRIIEVLLNLKNNNLIEDGSTVSFYIEKPSCASCLFFLVQTQALISQGINVNLELSNKPGARVSRYLEKDGYDALLYGPNGKNPPTGFASNGLLSMIRPALNDILDSLAQELVEAGIGTSDLDKIKIALNRIITEAITGNYEIVIRDEVTQQVLERHQSIMWFMEQLAEINRLWGLVRGSNQP